MRKTKSIRLHARRRMEERFGINLSDRMHREVVRQIQSGEATFVEKQSNSKSVFDIIIPIEDVERVENVKIRVIYDKNRKQIITALYPPAEVA